LLSFITRLLAKLFGIGDFIGVYPVDSPEQDEAAHRKYPWGESHRFLVLQDVYYFQGLKMKKNTFTALVSMIMLISSIHGNGFVIKLASYSNKESLLDKIQLLDTSVKENITIIEEDTLYKLFSNSSQSKEKVLKLLPIYQKVFADAYIMVNSYKQIPQNKIPQSEDINISLSLKEESNNSTSSTTLDISPTAILMSPTIEETPQLSFQEIIENKTFYLCPQIIQSKSEKILIEATFSNHSVQYKTLIGKVPSMHMDYIVQKNRLYLITNHKISISQFHTIDQIFFEYMIVGRWFRGKKIHQMRYYKKEADARSYINSISLN